MAEPTLSSRAGLLEQLAWHKAFGLEDEARACGYARGAGLRGCCGEMCSTRVLWRLGENGI
ncbi:hypothetical protein OH76DRAFT_1490947 [Lentinus brumalis]|uniref:Uncharacterized protein n=1 Tax=Lentinus brumalis TaxID=2498619 RepID=A0A371CH80_9APHY|nr:hypothetical protein OH76DRAFT_1490947 [Polyporus brumalis]